MENEKSFEKMVAGKIFLFYSDYSKSLLQGRGIDLSFFYKIPSIVWHIIIQYIIDFRNSEA